MLNIIEIISITSMWCLGLTIASQPDMVFESWQVWAEDKRYAKPLISCIWCMPSVHSVFGYAFAFGLGIIKVWSWRYLVMWPLVICGASLLNGLLWGIASLLMSANRYYEALMQPQEPNDERPIDEEPKEHYLK